MKAQILTNILTDFFGSLNFVNYLVGFGIMFLGLVLRWTFRANKAKRTDPKSPQKLSLKYWWVNNWLRKLKNTIQIIIISFLVIRFSFEITGEAFSYALALSIGLAFDAYKKKFIEYMKSIRKKLLG